MKKLIVFLLIFLVIPSRNIFPLFQQVQGLESVQIKRVVISSFDSSFIYVASKNSLYKSQDGGKTFQRVSVFKNEQIQHIFFDPYLANTLYIATSRHLYVMKNELEKLFSSPGEEVIYTAAKHKGIIFVGTSKGLSFSSGDILTWEKSKRLDNTAVCWIEPVKENLYLATEKGVYLFIGKNKIERLFVMREEEAGGEEGEQRNLSAKVIKADIFDKKRLWLGTNRGLFVSLDEGVNWKKIYMPGIDNLFINCLVQTNLENNTLYLGTTKGFFVVDLKKNTSKEIFEGLYSSYISWVEFAPPGKIYLATAKGLFSNDYFAFSHQGNRLEAILMNEPSIQKIQQAALRYNEVHPDKIKKWRNRLKYRALFPDISLDYDKMIWGTSSSGGSSYVGPRDWGISFSWDVGDLIWNSYEDDVDTRARLNTQLRLDILDEINRVYFERLRLKREIVNSSFGEEELFKQELRLKELTAILDGYTGGYFSRLKKRVR